MIAAGRFLETIRRSEQTAGVSPTHIQVFLRGALAFTGKGHATDRAVALGLLGFAPESLDPNVADRAMSSLRERRTLVLAGLGCVAFDPDCDIVFDYETLEQGHPNQLRFIAFSGSGEQIAGETFFSTGGGFVQSADWDGRNTAIADPKIPVPYEFRTAKELVDLAHRHGMTIAQIVLENESRVRPRNEVDRNLAEIWTRMRDCMNRGLTKTDTLPGGLNVRRRAASLYTKLQNEQFSNHARHYSASEWLATYAMAVNEENAAGGQVVTAPTNGAAGVLPSVLRYYLDHHSDCDPTRVGEFLLTAGIIGALIKLNASISGAEVGCQGEVGAASAMAAGGLCAVLGGSPDQIENAAEIALEQHLGMTCDPVAGLVQVPCIERNGFGAVKAVTAASLALRGDGQHFMPLDNCIEAMRQTGLEMHSKFKETALGGLAVNIPNC